MESLPRFFASLKQDYIMVDKRLFVHLLTLVSMTWPHLLHPFAARLEQSRLLNIDNHGTDQ